MGVPVKLGRGGITQVVEIELTDEERTAFTFADAVRELVDAMAAMPVNANGRASAVRLRPAELTACAQPERLQPHACQSPSRGQFGAGGRPYRP